VSGLEAPRQRWWGWPFARPAPPAHNPLIWGDAPDRSWSLSHVAARALENRRAFILLPFLMIAGLVVYRIWPEEPPLLLHLAGWTAVAVVFIIARGHLAFLRAGTFAAAALLGFMLLPVHGALFGTPMLERVHYGTYDARVELVLRDDGESTRLLVGDIQAIEPDGDAPDIRRARLTVSTTLDVAPGDRVTGRMRFYPVPAPIVPGGYDAQFVSYFDGVGAYGTAFGVPEIVRGEEGSLRSAIEWVRRAIAARIDPVLGPQIGGVATALINGDQSRVTQDDWDIMAVSGLAHVISISGLHLTLVAGAVYAGIRLGLALLPRLTGRLPVKKIAAAVGILAAFGYLLISGMSVPAIRSTLMIALVFLAVIVGRRALTMRNVALAGLAILLLDPASVFTASFQLSFAAMIALIAAYEMVTDRKGEDADLPRRRSGILTAFAGTAFTSLVAGGATALFTAYHFQQTAPFGVLGNLLAMPVISFVMMPAALIAVLLMPFGLEALPLEIMGWSIEVMLAIAHWVGSISGGFDPSPLLASSALLVLGLGLAWLAFLEGRWRLLGPALAVAIVLLVTIEPRPDILIADGSQAIAARDGDGLILIAGRNDTFATDVWSERYMEPITSIRQADHCDEIGCIFTLDPHGVVAVPKHPAAVREDCGLAVVLIARFPVSDSCRAATQVIDSNDLQRGGAHALYWNADEGDFIIRPMIDDPGRPWRLPVSE